MSPAARSEGLEDSLPALLPLRNHVQHYAWGDPRFIPSLLGIDNPDEKPHAELWMGAHPDLPSEVELADGRVPLDELIEQSPQEILGQRVSEQFEGRLPYLFKVLSAASPLSIQVHPSKQRAEEGFAREQTAGIPLSAPERNYRDRNHKPELIVALTDFFALRGFRPLEEIAEVIVGIPEISNVGGTFEPTSDSLAALYEKLMTMPQEQIDAALDPCVRRTEAAHAHKPYSRSDREYWLLQCDRVSRHDGHHDRGLSSVLLLNLLKLSPGEALSLDAGVLHAYLEGSGMELMANSNNVIRGGLTPKHVDVPELLRNVRFDAEPAERLIATRQSETAWLYETPFQEFALWRIEVGDSRSHTAASRRSAEIIFVASANESVTVTSETESIELKQGEAVLARRDVEYRIDARSDAELFIASVPRP